MGLRPMRGALNAPKIDDISDEIISLGLDSFEEFQKILGLARLGAQMDIRYEKRSVASAQADLLAGLLHNPIPNAMAPFKLFRIRVSEM
jgi:hypothetical protein